jgi:hypothetical protein
MASFEMYTLRIRRLETQKIHTEVHNCIYLRKCYFKTQRNKIIDLHIIGKIHITDRIETTSLSQRMNLPLERDKQDMKSIPLTIT